MENTQYTPFLLSLFKDHLHIRGEYGLENGYSDVQSGSSPHTWRIPALKISTCTIFRIISTYVENTMTVHVKPAFGRDHLHIRGEYLGSYFLSSSKIGSSPHTWRIRFINTTTLNSFRIISTYVENTFVWLPKVRLFWDHLHIRGEY